MVRVDQPRWFKYNVELTDGRTHFSVVFTRKDQSDWSVLPLDSSLNPPVMLRLTRHAEALRIEIEENGRFRLVRLAFLGMPETVDAGTTCCSPVGEGLPLNFSSVDFVQPRLRERHD